MLINSSEDVVISANSNRHYSQTICRESASFTALRRFFLSLKSRVDKRWRNMGARMRSIVTVVWNTNRKTKTYGINSATESIRRFKIAARKIRRQIAQCSIVGKCSVAIQRWYSDTYNKRLCMVHVFICICRQF